MNKEFRILIDKYSSYEAGGNIIFAVTLSTFIKSDSFARSDRMRHMWDNHFIEKVISNLPYKLKSKLDHDYVIEQSPGGHYHYHGVIAMTPDASAVIWKDGALKRQLARDLSSFKHAGQNRPFRVNAFLIEPVNAGDLKRWISYITKCVFCSST